MVGHIFLEWGKMNSPNTMFKIVNLLKEAKAEAIRLELRTLTYFIDMALEQTREEAENSAHYSVESDDLNKVAR